MLKKIIKKILNPEQRDWLRYRIVKINYYLNNFYKTYSFKLPFSKNKIDYRKLNKITNQDSGIFFFYYYYNKFFGSYRNINYFRNCCLKILANSKNNTLINSKIKSDTPKQNYLSTYNAPTKTSPKKIKDIMLYTEK